MSSDLPGYPLPRECPYRPSPGMARLHALGPITRVRLYDGRATWLVTGPAEARALLADRRVSSRADLPNYPVMDPRHLEMRATREMAQQEEGGFAAALFGMDPPEHTRQRQILIPRFTVRQVAKLRDEIQRIVDDHLDILVKHGPPTDFVTEFANPVPMMVVCAHLGVPYSDRETFEPAIRGLFDPERAEQAMADLNEYLGRLIETRVAEPDRGLIDDLVADGVDPVELTAFAMAILVAGTVTTSSVLALGTLSLLDNPGQWELLHQNPDLVTGAVEELLRDISLVEQLARVATDDIELSGAQIRAGDGILVSFAAANLDPTVTDHPGGLDVTRPPSNHLAFSYGIHHCLGHNLARLELEIAFRSLVRRIPTLKSVLRVEQIPMHQDGDVTRLTCFPVTW